jgi:hypothetical protein
MNLISIFTLIFIIFIWPILLLLLFQKLQNVTKTVSTDKIELPYVNESIKV